MSSLSFCSGYRYGSQRPFLMHQKPPEFSWFSNALKNIKETNDHTKVQGEMQDSHAAAIVSPIGATDGKYVTTELETNDKLLEMVTDEIKSKSEETILRDTDQMNPTYTHKLNWETHRKSLTAMYLEKKANLMNELQERLHNSESESIAIAKDEGPVRQSLLSLVKDEDVPELMEAMAEKLEFVFEDLTPSASGAGEGILRNTAKRARPRVRETKLEFHSSSPTVFTYPDEESAVEKAQWDEGKQITYSLYRELCKRKKEHSELPVHENHELQNPLRPSPATSNADSPLVRTVTLMEEPSMAESLLGVTGRISYNNVPLGLNRSLPVNDFSPQWRRSKELEITAMDVSSTGIPAAL
uniref:Uncharacterized protein n=1 Tax=Setaria digitata TaxID=48799 RepID=A0A915PI36_9BILA